MNKNKGKIIRKPIKEELAYKKGFIDGMLHEVEMLTKLGLRAKTTRKDEPKTYTGTPIDKGNVCKT